MSKAPLDLSLVIACYQEEPHLVRNVLKLVDYLQATRLRFELIFVDDASTDGTRCEIDRAVAALKSSGVRTTVLFNDVNQGRGATVMRGVMAARGTVAGFCDIDLEFGIDSILPMVMRVQSGECDFVVARRVTAFREASLVRMTVSVGYQWLRGRLLSLPVSDTESGCKFFVRERMLPVLSTVEDRRWFWDTEVIYRATRAGLSVMEHPVVFRKDKNKQSTVRLVHDSVAHFRALIGLILSPDPAHPVSVEGIPREGDEPSADDAAEGDDALPDAAARH